MVKWFNEDHQRLKIFILKFEDKNETHIFWKKIIKIGERLEEVDMKVY